MQERGDLVQQDGVWVEGPSLDWEALPPRVEAVIEERIGRLEAELREILTIASVEGEDFTAQVVARVQKADERKLIQQLGQELNKRYRLVGEEGVRLSGKAAPVPLPLSAQPVPAVYVSQPGGERTGRAARRGSQRARSAVRRA